MSRPYALPVGPTRRAESRTSMPPPEPRSRTISPGLSSASAVGLPQPSEARTAAVGSAPTSSIEYSALEIWLGSGALPQQAGPALQQSLDVVARATAVAA